MKTFQYYLHNEIGIELIYTTVYMKWHRIFFLPKTNHYIAKHGDITEMTTFTIFWLYQNLNLPFLSVSNGFVASLSWLRRHLSYQQANQLWSIFYDNVYICHDEWDKHYQLNLQLYITPNIYKCSTLW